VLTRRRLRVEGRNASPLIRCHLAREAISALVDGEEPPVSEAITSAHLAQCRLCGEFQASVLSLTRQIRVRALAPAPGNAGEILELLGYTNEAPAPRHGWVRPWAERYRFSLVRASQWAAGIVPLGLALPALALGAFAHIHVVPSHVPSPCTMALHHHRM
jgi:anti-sigma factor RsiW